MENKSKAPTLNGSVVEREKIAMPDRINGIIPSNPIPSFFARQIDDKINYKRKLIEARFASSTSMFKKDLYSHFGCVNAIEFSKLGNLLISGGDDRRVLLWDIERAIQNHGKPIVMKAQHTSNIFCLGYDCTNSKIFSAGNDDQVIVHDLNTTDAINFFRHEKPIYGLSTHPDNDYVFASACDDGRVLIYDIRGSVCSPESFVCLAQYKSPFHSVVFNPTNPVLLATANAKEGVGLWDIRKPLKPVLRYGSEGPMQSCMNVRFNSAGNTLLALRRRLPPVLYAIDSTDHVCQFDHPGYYNSCTMKSCYFAGYDDDYILSGSDDFNLYVWKIPRDDQIKWIDSAHIILKGHRSIVNQVRYNPANCVIASSGVEKIIKLWSPFPFDHEKDDCKIEKQRRVFSHDEYIGLILRSGQFMTHDYSHQSTVEDPRMMAFFDSLVQREIEGWSSSVSSAPQSPSENESSERNSERNYASDSDSRTSDRQIMLSILGSTLNSQDPAQSPIVSETSSESPNRITRLIANRREKLMRLAQESKKKNAVTNATSNNANSDTASDMEVYNNNNHNIVSKHIYKRKNNKNTSKHTRLRKKLKLEECNGSDDNVPVDSTLTQPSTSSGVVSSRRSCYSSPSIANNHTRSSSSSSEDSVNFSGKKKYLKIDSDTSNIETGRKYQSKHNGNKAKYKNQNLCSDNNCESKKENETITIHEGNQSNRTPTKITNSKINPDTSDSGITSGISTNEKCKKIYKNNNLLNENSDEEEAEKNVERFKKKIDVAKRNYRKRVMVKTVSNGTSTSTDDDD